MEFADGTAFCFTDDQWYMLDRWPVHRRRGGASLTFVPLPANVRPLVKRFIAHLWLNARQAGWTIQGTLTHLKQGYHLLASESHAVAPIELNAVHSDVLRGALLTGLEHARPILEAATNERSSAVATRLRAAGGVHPHTAIGIVRTFNKYAQHLREEHLITASTFRASIPKDALRWWDTLRRDGARPADVIPEPVMSALLRACDAELAKYRDAAAVLAQLPPQSRAEWLANRVKAERERKRRTRERAEALEAGREPPADPARKNDGSAVYQRYSAALRNAVLAQALRLTLVLARRREAIVTLPAHPRVRWDEVDGLRILNVDVTAWKLHGELGLPEWVPAPGYFGEVADDALRTLNELTSRLRTWAPEDIRGRLLLVPRWFAHGETRKGKPPDVRAVDPDEIGSYLWCEQGRRKRKGIVQRYGIAGAETVRTHLARHTATNAILEHGGGAVLAARYLGHFVRDENDPTVMLRTAYVAGGTAANRARMLDDLSRGRATGLRFDARLRLVTRAAGPHVEQLPVAPNELTYAEALRRIRYDLAVLDDPVTPEQVRALLEQELVMNFTHYGACILPATTGPCPTAEKCPLGVNPEAEETQEGRGCPHQVLMPHALDQLDEDIAGMEVQLEWCRTRPAYRFWAARLERRLRVWRRMRQRCVELGGLGG